MAHRVLQSAKLSTMLLIAVPGRLVRQALPAGQRPLGIHALQCTAVQLAEVAIGN
jgi:hypothetical protein